MVGVISRKRVSESAVAIGVALFIGAMSLIWIRVASPLGDNLRVTFFSPLILLAALATYQPWVLFVARSLTFRLAPLLGFYFIYLILLGLLFPEAGDTSMVRRQFIYIIGALFFGLGLACCSANRRALRLGGVFGVIAFVLFVEIFARSIGMNLIGIFQQFARTGDFDFLVFEVWREIFRAASSSPEDVVGSEKNTVSIALLLTLIFARIGAPRDQSDWLGRAITAVCVILLLMLNTRIVLISFLICLILALAIDRQATGRFFKGRFALSSAFAGVLALTFAGIFIADSTAAMALFERFAFEDDSAGSRVTQLTGAFAAIESAPIAGRGFTLVDGTMIHNLFFAAWVHAGFVAFLLTVVTYAIILRALVQHIYLAAMRPETWTLPIRPEWVAGLPVFSLLSPWVSGDAGHPSATSWIGIVAFLTIIWLNDRNRQTG